MDSDRNSNITACILRDGDTHMHVNINMKMTGGVCKNAAWAGMCVYVCVYVDWG